MTEHDELERRLRAIEQEIASVRAGWTVLKIIGSLVMSIAGLYAVWHNK